MQLYLGYIKWYFVYEKGQAKPESEVEYGNR